MEYGYIKKHYDRRKGQKAQSKSKPFHYVTEDGYDIYVGKNNFQNDVRVIASGTGHSDELTLDNVPRSVDIEKGDNWDKTISSELSECKYGIICLTSDNTSAPWINFEAGAIAKSLDSKVTALMVNIKPSDIKGPLSRYQATRFERADFFQLIESINKALDTPLDSKVLENTFNAMWDSLEAEAMDLINKFSQKGDSQNKKGHITESEENNPLEEILQLLRKQSAILSNPQQLLPPDYMEHIQMSMYSRNREMYTENQMIFEELINVLEKTLIRLQNFPNHPVLNQFIEIFNYEL